MLITIDGRNYIKYPYNITIEQIEKMQQDHNNLQFIFSNGQLYMTIIGATNEK